MTWTRLAIPAWGLCCALALCPLASRAVINGSDDATGAYAAVAAFGSGCSSVLVAPQVMLTSGHCMPAHALSCTNVATSPLAVTFAEPDGGWTDLASFNARTIQVQGFVRRSELFDLSQCSSADTYDCSDAERPLIDPTKELIVMYLAAEAPADATPLPILVHPSTDTSHSAAEVGVFPTLETWVQSEPVVTTVGYGVGSHAETVGTMQLRGRDYGLQRWVETSTDFAGFLGASDCNTLVASASRPGVVVSPADLTAAQVGDPWAVAAGQDWQGSQHSHSGGGDSGGPVLVGQGIGAKGDAPTPYAGPGGGSSYDPGRNYVAGTASLWVSYGGELATGFNPTWTASASAFLMSALYDSDGDRWADPVDEDRDGDGCDNGVDQHPDDRWVPIGTEVRPNCSPSTAPWLGDESLDSDSDGVPNCRDDDDDGDLIPDEQDGCPVHAGNLCVKAGPPCPWNRAFFDCRTAGCFELLVRFSSLINPDPTRELFFPVLQVAEGVLTVGPAEGMTAAESARMLARGAISAGRISGVTTLEVVGPYGRVGPDTVGGVLAAYEPGRVRVRDLRGATALELRFGRDGRSLEIAGTRRR
jgi:hypothetical protein